ncbi:hypothetical protein WJX73_003891 [Symbiochloris irregularis]|uniref:Uncharacterized protein n=1 Tax=Symbiochloris irregularis TaxID=706552 RepID=A0AAW1PXC5_9CHLO
MARLGARAVLCGALHRGSVSGGRGSARRHQQQLLRQLHQRTLLTANTETGVGCLYCLAGGSGGVCRHLIRSPTTPNPRA